MSTFTTMQEFWQFAEEEGGVTVIEESVTVDSNGNAVCIEVNRFSGPDCDGATGERRVRYELCDTEAKAGGLHERGVKVVRIWGPPCRQTSSRMQGAALRRVTEELGECVYTDQPLTGHHEGRYEWDDGKE